jgi:hypothetical protein
LVSGKLGLNWAGDGDVGIKVYREAVR